LEPASQPAPQYLFAYGTLQPGHAPGEIADVVRGFEMVGQGTVLGRLYDLGSYPGAVLDDNSRTRISGTVYQLPAGEGILATLDAYEEFEPGTPQTSLFLRRLYPVLLADGPTLDCWVYEYNGPVDRARMIESGTFARPR
jgi:gamma-glutamylcyclotransferase (GGCT)/AIG2-like uncharacterized protein YtfP